MSYASRYLRQKVFLENVSLVFISVHYECVCFRQWCQQCTHNRDCSRCQRRATVYCSCCHCHRHTNLPL